MSEDRKFGTSLQTDLRQFVLVEYKFGLYIGLFCSQYHVFLPELCELLLDLAQILTTFSDFRRGGVMRLLIATILLINNFCCLGSGVHSRPWLWLFRRILRSHLIDSRRHFERLVRHNLLLLLLLKLFVLQGSSCREGRVVERF